MMMTAACTSSPMVSVRSTLANKNVVSAEKRMDVVRLRHGELVSPDVLSLGQRFLNRNCDFYSVSNDVHTLTFKNQVQVNSWTVDYRLVMKACVDSRGVESFLFSFYRNPNISFVSTGLVRKALARCVQDEVSKNLQFVDVTRVTGPVKNARRHNNLAAACAKMGILCLNDELTLERVS